MTGLDEPTGARRPVGEGSARAVGVGEEVDVAGIVVAGGSGDRLGAEVPKAFVDLAGATLLQRAVTALRTAGIDDLVAVVPDGWQRRARRVVGTDVAVVAGGATRTASVAAGLAALGPTVTVVAVHDAARALVPPPVVAAAIHAVAAGSVEASGVVAAAPGLAVGDTLKRVDADHVVVDTVDRRELVAIQTPQVFDRAVLARAHDRAARSGNVATDDLALVESLVADGVVTGRVVVTDGSPMAMKVTRPDDLVVAEALARYVDGAAGRPADSRAGSPADSAIGTADEPGSAGRDA